MEQKLLSDAADLNRAEDDGLLYVAAVRLNLLAIDISTFMVEP